MKRIITLVFFILFLPITIMALEKTSRDVLVGEVEGEDEEVISVKVDWDSLKFIYYYETDYVWNSTTHKYETTTKEYWSNKSNIKITNNSNKKINVKTIFNNSLNIVSGIFSDDNFSIKDHSKKEITFGMKGRLPKEYNTYTKAGVITLQFE